MAYKHTLLELLGKNRPLRNLNMPTYLTNFINAVKGSGLSTEDIIYNHTAYPFVIPFKTNSKRETTFNNMLNPGSKPASVINQINQLMTFDDHFHHCSKCFEEDIFNYGESYWRRIHQMPGVLICPHHNELLMKTKRKVPIADFIYPDSMSIFEESNKKKMESSTFSFLNKFSQEVFWLLNNKEFINTDLLNDEIRRKLKVKGYYRKEGIDRKKLTYDILNHYDRQVLEILNSQVIGKGWTFTILNKGDGTTTIKYLLLILFLWDSVEQFMSSARKDKCNENKKSLGDFGEKPWPCLNPACVHYKNEVINDFVLKKCPDTKRFYGVFRCECGFTYSRLQHSEKHNISNKISLGPILIDKLFDLISKGEKVKDIATKLELGLDTVSKYKLYENKENYYKIKKEEKVQLQTLNKEKLLYRRKRWLELLKKNKNNSDVEYRRLLNWLRKNDKEWIKKNKKIKEKFDWEKRDKELLIEIKSLVSHWNELESIKPKRITKYALYCQLNRYLPLKTLDKVPLTTEYLNSIVETDEQFQIRRIKWGIDLLKEKDENLTIRNISIIAKIEYSKTKELLEFIIKDERL